MTKQYYTFPVPKFSDGREAERNTRTITQERTEGESVKTHLGGIFPCYKDRMQGEGELHKEIV